MVSVLTTFPDENQYIKKEQNSGKSYTTLAYYISRFLAEMPLQMFLPIMYGSIIYWSCNLNAALDRFGWFLLLLTLEGLCATALGFAVSAIAKTSQVAIAIAIIIIIVIELR